MDPAAILALLADMYTQVSRLQEENQALRAQLAGQAQQQPGQDARNPGHQS